MFYKKFILLFIVLFSIGCTSNPLKKAKSPVWPWPNAKLVCQKNPTCDGEDLRRYLEANIYCRAVHNFYEKGGNTAGNTQLAIGTVGALAGAVVAPLASVSAAKAWAGLSGTANALQTSVRDNFHGSLAAKRTAAVLLATTQGIAKYKGAQTPKARVVAAINMATACAMAPAQADNEAIKALSK